METWSQQSSGKQILGSVGSMAPGTPPVPRATFLRASCWAFLAQRSKMPGLKSHCTRAKSTIRARSVRLQAVFLLPFRRGESKAAWSLQSPGGRSELLASVFSSTKWKRQASLGAQTDKKPPAIRETWVRPLGWENPLEKGPATHSSVLVWRTPMDRGAWWPAVHGVTKSRTRQSDRAQHPWKRQSIPPHLSVLRAAIRAHANFHSSFKSQALRSDRSQLGS